MKFHSKLFCLFVFFASPIFAQQPAWSPTDSGRQNIPYDYVSEADIIWQKGIWRFIDVREKINLPFKYPEEPLITILLDLLRNGEVKCYTEDDFLTVKPVAKVLSIGSSMDTISIMDPLSGEFMRDTAVASIFNPESVLRFRLKEEWFVDKETSTLNVRILGLAPMYHDAQWNIDIPMCWFYYPDLRKKLALHKFFNQQNNMKSLTWEDAFEMRLFSSHIIEESNVYGRRIVDYKSGLEGVLESELIKGRIVGGEDDLWSH